LYKADQFHVSLFWYLFEFQVSGSHCVGIIGEHGGADEAFSSIKNYCSTSTMRLRLGLSLSFSPQVYISSGLIELQVRDEPYWRSIKAVVPTLLGGGALFSQQNNGHTKRLASISIQRKSLVAAALTLHVMTLMTPARGGG
jgi:hypothetical protein